MICIYFLVTSCIWHSSVAAWTFDKKALHIANTLVLCLFVVIFILVHLVLFIQINASLKSFKKLKDTDDRLKVYDNGYESD